MLTGGEGYTTTKRRKCPHITVRKQNKEKLNSSTHKSNNAGRITATSTSSEHRDFARWFNTSA